MLLGCRALANLSTKQCNKQISLHHQNHLLAQKNSVPQLFENVVGVARQVVGHASDLVNPFQHLGSVLFAVFAHNLEQATISSDHCLGL